MLCQVSEFLFGDGFAISGGDNWRVRRRAVGPSLHRNYLAAMADRVFGPSAQHLAAKLEVRTRLVHGFEGVTAGLFLVSPHPAVQGFEEGLTPAVGQRRW